jgi:hypothetical protein
MFSNNYTRGCLPVAFGLAVAVYVFVVPPALAGTSVDGRSPDTRDAASSAQEALPLTRLSPVERSILQEKANKNDPELYGPGFVPPSATRSAIESSADGRAIERVLARQEAARRSPPGSFDGRSPDTIDAAVQAQAPVVTVVPSPGFEWSDFGIGVASACAAMLLLGLSIRLLTARQHRKQTSPVATA